MLAAGRGLASSSRLRGSTFAQTSTSGRLCHVMVPPRPRTAFSLKRSSGPKLGPKEVPRGSPEAPKRLPRCSHRPPGQETRVDTKREKTKTREAKTREAQPRGDTTRGDKRGRRQAKPRQEKTKVREAITRKTRQEGTRQEETREDKGYQAPKQRCYPTN